jgi:hypothetical protein
MDLLWWATPLYARWGASYPVASLVVISMIGAVVFGAGWTIIGESYRREVAKEAAERQREEPNLQLLAPNRETYEPQIGGELWATIFTITYDVTVLNSGGKPLTVISATGRLSANSDRPSAAQSRLFPSMATMAEPSLFRRRCCH